MHGRPALTRSSLPALVVCLLSWAAWQPSARAADAPAAAPAGKLVVTKAFYGDLPDGAKTDVTEKVAGW